MKEIEVKEISYRTIEVPDYSSAVARFAEESNKRQEVITNINKSIDVQTNNVLDMIGNYIAEVCRPLLALPSFWAYKEHYVAMEKKKECDKDFRDPFTDDVRGNNMTVFFGLHSNGGTYYEYKILISEDSYSWIKDSNISYLIKYWPRIKDDIHARIDYIIGNNPIEKLDKQLTEKEEKLKALTDFRL